ncbi:MAG TPA: hypothetical protein DCP08_02485 [Chloroflexi bacterium]|nr:hypothetical protein [Chloroflexota bacterium]
MKGFDQVMRLGDLIPARETTGSSLILQEKGNYLFALERGARGASTVYCYGLGGHKREGETWIECAEREAQEELGTRIELLSSKVTYYMNRHGELEKIGVDEEVIPLLLFEMVFPAEASWNPRNEGWIYYIVAYRARLCQAPAPLDIEGLISLSEAQIRQTAEGEVTLGNLLDDGARLWEKEPIAREAKLTPVGTAWALSRLLAQEITLEGMRKG